MQSTAMQSRSSRPSSPWLVLSVLGWAVAIGALTWIFWIHPAESEAASATAVQETAIEAKAADPAAVLAPIADPARTLPPVADLTEQRLETERELIDELMAELEAAERKTVRLEAELAQRRADRRQSTLDAAAEASAAQIEAADTDVETSAGAEPDRNASLAPVVLDPPLFWTDTEMCNCISVRGQIQNTSETPVSGYVRLELYDADRKVTERLVAMTLPQGKAKGYSVDLRPSHMQPRGFADSFSVRVGWES